MPVLNYTPPPVNTNKVLYGTGLAYWATVGTSLPADANLGVGASWISGGWNYVGATDSGVDVTWNPSTNDINIEEQPTPVAVLVDKATAVVSLDLNEETLANVNLAWGNAGTIAVTAAGAGQPGKSVLTLSTSFPTLALAVVGKNDLGFARVLSIPGVMSTGSVKTTYRRSAAQRMYPVSFNATCAVSAIQWIDLQAVATS